MIIKNVSEKENQKTYVICLCKTTVLVLMINDLHVTQKPSEADSDSDSDSDTETVIEVGGMKVSCVYLSSIYKYKC